MNAIIFDHIFAAQEWDFANNSFDGNATRYRWPLKILSDTTTLTKLEYAGVMGIPTTTYNENDEEIANPAYTALSSSYTLHKAALIVGNDFATYSQDGLITGHTENVVTIQESDLLELSND